MSDTAVSTAVAQFTESVTNAFTEYTDAPTAVVTEIEAAGEQLAEQVGNLESSHEITQRSQWELEDAVIGELDLANTRFEDQSIVEQLDNVEATLEDANHGGESGEPHLHDTLLADTPLEQVCGMTDQESREHLSENQHRARNIALVATKIGKKTPNGYVISNKKYREELAAMLGKYPNDNTVKRTREFLDWFGKNNVRLIDHRGCKKVVIDTAYAKQLGRTSYSPEECLVIEHKNSWKDMLGLHPSGNGGSNVSATA